MREIRVVGDRRVVDLRDPEVQHLHELGIITAMFEVDVLRFEIAMHDAERVRLRERVAHAPSDRDDALPWHPALRLVAIVDALAGEQLHHEIRGAIRRFTGICLLYTSDAADEEDSV